MNSIKVTILGSGTCYPSLERSACSVLLEINNNKILLDSGPGTIRRLLRTGNDIFDISHIFYSHFHPDHTCEIIPFLFGTNYSGERERTFPLSIIAGNGFKNFYNNLKSAYGSWIELKPGFLKISELDIEKKTWFQFYPASIC